MGDDLGAENLGLAFGLEAAVGDDLGLAVGLDPGGLPVPAAVGDDVALAVGAIGGISGLRKASILFFWDASLGVGTEPRRGGDLVFGRNSTALWHDQRGKVRERAVDSPRMEWGRVRGVPRRLFRGEHLATQELIDAADLTGAAWSGAAQVTDSGLEAPREGWTAWRVEDDDAGAIEIRIQHFPGIAAGRYTGTWYLRKRADAPGHVCSFEMRVDDGGSARFPILRVDPRTGEHATFNSPLGAGVEDRGDWWRVWLTDQHDAAGAELYWMVTPARHPSLTAPEDASLTGHQVLALPNLVNLPYPISPIEGAAPVSIAPDVWYWRGTPRVVPVAIYLDMLWGINQEGGGSGSHKGLLEFGSEAEGFDTTHLGLRVGDSGDLRASISNGTDPTISRGVNPQAGPGDPVEAVLLVDGQGRVRPVAVRPNGQVVGTSFSAAPAAGLPASWGDRVWLNDARGGSRTSVGRYARAMVVELEHVMAPTDGSGDPALIRELRAFADEAPHLLRAS